MQVSRSGLGAGLLVVGAVLAFVVWRPAPIPTASGPSAEAISISRGLMSPFCHGLLLSDCPSPNAAILRSEIRQRLAAGETADLIQADLLRRYGPEIKASPDADGAGLVVWWAPLAIGGAGFVGLVTVVRRSTRRAAPVVPVPASIDARLAERLDEELEDLL